MNKDGLLKMSNMINYAKDELERAGWFDEDSDYGGMVGKDVMELMRVFSDQGHSGYSAGLIIGIFTKLAMMKPITPLTGEDDEWVEVGDGLFQNKRMSGVFKDEKQFGGHPYFLDGKIFKLMSEDGGMFTSDKSITPVIFPCIPESVTISLDDEEEYNKYPEAEEAFDI